MVTDETSEREPPAGRSHEGVDAPGRGQGGGAGRAGGGGTAEVTRPRGRGGRSSGDGRADDAPGRGAGRDAPAERGVLSAVGRWTYLTGDRPAVVVLGTGLLFAGLFVLGVLGVVDVGRPERVTTVFSTLVTGLFTLVTITVSINQLVLSRILGSPERIRDRIESVHAFRERVSGSNRRVSVAPTEPAAFLEVVTRALRDRAEALESTFDDERDPQLRREVDGFVSELVGLADDVDRRIGSDRLSLFAVLLPVLGNRYSAYVNTVDRIRATSGELSPAEERALSELRAVLVAVNQTRHYFKTLYLHEALSTLSLRILVTGAAAVVVGFVVILSYAVPPGGAGPVQLATVSASLALATAPLLVLFAYGARVATIAAQTTTFGTFTPVEELP